MTNGEKFKTAEERFAAFIKFCEGCPGCKKCELSKYSEVGKCKFAWLELEYNEALKPCPFCGSTPVIADNIETMRSLSYYVRCACGVRTVSALSKSVVAEILNRRVK